MDDDGFFLTVYDELRGLARKRLTGLPPGNTLQPTALVHEAFLRIEKSDGKDWNSRGHFFSAASEAMRQILVEQARRKSSLKHGGAGRREDAETDQLAGLLNVDPDVVLTIHEAVEELEEHDEELAEIVKLRYFSGLSMTEIASLTEIPRRTLHRRWRFAAAQLRRRLTDAGLDEGFLDGGGS